MDKRSRHVLFSVKEQILILRSYKKNGDNWRQVYREVLQNVGGLPWKAQSLYKENSFAQIQKRMSSQVQKLISIREELIEDEELRSLVRSVRENGPDNQHEERKRDADKTENKEKKKKITTKYEGEYIFKLSEEKFVTVNEFHGQVLVGLRKFYMDDDGLLKPGRTGISLTLEQWTRLKEGIGEIDDAMEHY